MLKRIATNAAALAVGGAVAQLAFIAVEIAIARHLGQGDYGTFATVQAIALGCLIVLDLGMTWWTIESGSRDPASLPDLVGTTLALKIGGFIVLYPAACLGLLALGYDTAVVGFFMVFLFYSLTMAVQDTWSAVYTARQQMIVNALFQGAAPLVIAVLVALVMLLGFGLPGVGVAFVAGGAFIAVIWGAMTWRAVGPRIKLAASGEILRGSYLYGLSSLLVHLFRKGDILVLSVLSTMPEVGLYAAGAKLLDLAYKIPMVGTLAVSPELFAQSESDSGLYRRSADAFVRFSMSLGLMIAVACFHSASWLIGLLFGPEYDGAAVVLQVLSASFALKFLAYALQTVLTTNGQHGWRTAMLGVSTGLALVGYLALIPRLGAVGAAISVVGAEVVLTALYLLGIRDTALRGTLFVRLATWTLAAIASVAVPVSIGVQGPVASALAILVAVSVLFATGFVRLNELRDMFSDRKAGRQAGGLDSE